MRSGWVHIMTNRPNGALRLGATADSARRASARREGLCEDIAAAVQRGSAMKDWPRAVDGRDEPGDNVCRLAEPSEARVAPDDQSVNGMECP
jgi:hypothetical protein